MAVNCKSPKFSICTLFQVLRYSALKKPEFQVESISPIISCNTQQQPIRQQQKISTPVIHEENGALLDTKYLMGMKPEGEQLKSDMKNRNQNINSIMKASKYLINGTPFPL